MAISPSGATVWRDYSTDGVPVSGAHKVQKGQVRAWSSAVEARLDLVSIASATFQTRAALFSALSYAPNTTAWVYGDSTVAYNGVYLKVGSSGAGSWTRVGDLPYSFVRMNDAGAGTANAIQFTSSIPASESVLRIANVFEANTGDVTVSENGGTAKPLLTASGNQIAPNGLLSGMMIAYLDNGTSFRLASDQASASIQAAAEAALRDFRTRFVGAFSGDSAADTYLTSAGLTKAPGTAYFNTTSTAWRYWDGDSWESFPYATIPDASLTASKFPAANETVNLPAIRKRLRNMPDLGDYGIFGGATNWTAADFAAMETALFADGHAKILVPAGANIRLGEQVTITRGVFFEGEGISNSVFSFFHNNTGFLFTGQNGAGGGMSDLSVVKGDTGNANSFVYLLANVGGWAPDFFKIDGVNLTGLVGGTASYPLLLDGAPRTGVAPNGLVGLRNVILRDLDIFNATFMSLEMRAVKALRATGVNIFQAAGSTQNTNITGSSTNQSAGVLIQGSTLGNVSVDWANAIIGYPNSMQNVTVTSNATVNQLGRAFGSVSNNSGTTTVFT